MSPKPRKAKRPTLAELDDDDFVRKTEILRALPIGESSWDRGVAEGRFPKPTKISPKVNAWKVRKIRELMAAWEAAIR